jgi:hypothetical protein
MLDPCSDCHGSQNGITFLEAGWEARFLADLDDQS